jgi:hypothetical protein
MPKKREKMKLYLMTAGNLKESFLSILSYSVYPYLLGLKRDLMYGGMLIVKIIVILLDLCLFDQYLGSTIP